ncbi:MAG: class I SAM-dependent methyltransferase [Nitriliruptoraceae bacterium]
MAGPRSGGDAAASMTGQADADGALVAGIRTAYGGGVDGWAAGPAVVYQRLADALVAAAGRPLAGRYVLDLGAGTGVASEVLSHVGAHPVALDLAVEMLAHRDAERPPGVAGDARALPFRDSAFDAVVAAFSLNHVPDLEGALAEARRVIRPGGLLLASTFPSGADHPAKATVEATLEEFGYRRPGWYATFKDRIADLTGDPDALVRAAAAAGLTEIRVDRVTVEAGLDRPETAVEWRLNMPHATDFVAELTASGRAALRARATAALPGELPSSVHMLILRGEAGPAPDPSR